MGLRGLRSPGSWGSELEPVDRERLRARVLAFGGLWLLLAGMLAAAGIWIFLVGTVTLLLLAAVGVAGLSALRRDETLEQLLGARERIRRSAAGVTRRARDFAEHRQSKPAEEDPRRQARWLNRLGLQLRRQREYEQAAARHRAALAIVRELGDEQAEAMTLNNLALALVHTDGGVPAAVKDFEQALDLLRGLGDEEHEGQVIANLASVRRRQGRDEDAETLLNAALDKLPPESEAYRQVEEQLRRAS